MSSESHELILTESGMPYKTQTAARAAMGSRKLSADDYEVVRHLDGFAISPINGPTTPTPPPPEPPPPGIRDKTYTSYFDKYDQARGFVNGLAIAQSFKDAIKILPVEGSATEAYRLEIPKWHFFERRDAEDFMRRGQMPEKMVKIRELDGGGCRIVERYWKVRFQQRSSQVEPEQVNISVQGDVLICPRERDTIMPESFLEAADHTQHQKSYPVPGRNRKRVVNVQTFPYQRLQEVEEEDFFKMRTEGTKKTKKDLLVYGPDLEHNPELAEGNEING
jgi:hypothetical protein